VTDAPPTAGLHIITIGDIENPLYAVSRIPHHNQQSFTTNAFL
jgi:hypothetical protein